MFDCDGLLLETESRWTIAEQRVCAAHGVAFHMDLKRRMLGTALPRAGAILADWVGKRPEDGPAMGEELLHHYRAAVAEEGVEPMPGVSRLLTDLHGRVPLAVASNSKLEDTRLVLAVSGLPDVFVAVVCAGGPIAPKPAPDLYLAACAALAAAPANTVAFEDSPTGAAAAMAAGMRVIGVPSTVGIRLDTPRVLGALTEISADELLD